MGSFIDVASAILSRSERQVEVAAQNISNANTPGYKRHLSFERVLTNASAERPGSDSETIATDFTPAKLISSDHPYDLAIAGVGFFVVGSENGVLYTRQGQFQRDGDGRLVNAEGNALQMDGGGDLVLKGGAVQVLADGSVLENGTPVGKLAIVDITNPQAARPAGGGTFSAPTDAVSPVDKPSVHQGMLEGSNVSLGQEMVSIMGAARHAETGQRLVTVYDDLIGRVLSTVGQSS